MAHDTARDTAGAPDGPGARSEGTGEVVRAVLLWVLVSAGLLYGVVATAQEAAALFGA